MRGNRPANESHPMPRISPEYMLADGSPRYGIRAAGDDPNSSSTPEPAAPEPQRGGDAAADAILREALTFDANQLATAQNYRFQQLWADQDDELIVAFRTEHPKLEEIAVRTTNEALEGSFKWFLRSVKPLAEVRGAVRKRRSTALRGSVNLVKLLIRTSRLLIVWLMITNPAPEAVAGGLVLLFLLRLFGKTNQARMKFPMGARLRWSGFRDHRRDITDAVLLALVLGNGHSVDYATAEAAGRGWKHLTFVAGKVDEIRRGPTPAGS